METSGEHKVQKGGEAMGKEAKDRLIVLAVSLSVTPQLMQALADVLKAVSSGDDNRLLVALQDLHRVANAVEEELSRFFGSRKIEKMALEVLEIVSKDDPNML